MKIALTLTFVLALFALSREARADTLAEVRVRGELRWAGDIQGGEPYVYEDQTGKLIGFEVEIAEAIARRLSVKSKFVQADWSNLVPSLERSDFDVVMNGLE